MADGETEVIVLKEMGLPLRYQKNRAKKMEGRSRQVLWNQQMHGKNSKKRTENEPIFRSFWRGKKLLKPCSMTDLTSIDHKPARIGLIPALANPCEFRPRELHAVLKIIRRVH